ncbi:NAD(P)H-dependent oxidoreductase subunit E [Ottowia thiooxydans]|uniref:NAD(P)H-dependent oxidoreductase subunit E n=1 Tax=Ottowia thiooxydans TaxID=219182 RepID=UPI0004086F5C|nr:NAD(P)H-dependent oxidoreductase subunit E [Ottowia thiooxydans]
MNARSLAAAPLDCVAGLVAVHRDRPGALLPLLHDIQDALGYVPAAAVEPIAVALNLSRAEVHGVLTYYHHFRTEPAVGVVVQVCRAEACQACGSEALFAHATQTLGSSTGGTSTEKAYSVESVYCLGLCASSPAMQVGDKLHARMTPEKFDRVIAAHGAAA